MLIKILTGKDRFIGGLLTDKDRICTDNQSFITDLCLPESSPECKQLLTPSLERFVLITDILYSLKLCARMNISLDTELTVR